jgi:hypothetical protein
MKKLILLFFFIFLVFPLSSKALTFGYEIAGSSLSYVYGDAFIGSLFTSPATGGTIQKLTAHTEESYSPDADAKGVIYLHSDLSLISNAISPTTDTGNGDGSRHWFDLSFSTNPNFSASTDYLLGLIEEITDNGFNYDSGDTNQGHRTAEGSTSYTTPPSTLPAITHSTNKYSIYATYQQASTPSVNIQSDLIIFE